MAILFNFMFYFILSIECVDYFWKLLGSTTSVMFFFFIIIFQRCFFSLVIKKKCIYIKILTTTTKWKALQEIFTNHNNWYTPEINRTYQRDRVTKVYKFVFLQWTKLFLCFFFKAISVYYKVVFFFLLIWIKSNHLL